MARTAQNVLVFNDLVVRQAVKDAAGKKQREWRFERVLNPGKGDRERRAPMPGLVLVTQPTSQGVFYKFYRNQTGALKKLRLGSYDEIGLEGARKLWEDQTLAVAGGSDPVGERHALKVAMTFKELAEAFLDKGQLSATTRGNYWRHLNNLVYPVIGAKPCETVTSNEVLAICRKLETRGHFALSNMAKSIIGGVYRYGRQQGLCKSNPVLGIGRRGQKVARDRTPTDAEIAALWEAIDSATEGETKRKDKGPNPARLSKAMALIIKLAIVTGQRRTEICGARVDELHGLDGASPQWIIKGDENKRGRIIEGRTKNGRTQVVPLSPLAADLFKEALQHCADKNFVFPADISRVATGKQARLPHIHGESVSKAVRRLRASVEGLEGVEEISLHDMRRAISNWLKNEGVSREVRDLVLNHTDPSVTEAHYSQSARMTKQVGMALVAWADHIAKVTGQAVASSNVVTLRA